MIHNQFGEAFDILKHFCLAAGIKRSLHTFDEQSHIFEVSATVECSVICSMGITELEKLRSICDTSISFFVESNDLTLFTLNNNYVSNWPLLPGKLSGAETCKVKLRVEKKQLVEKWFGIKSPQVRIYFCCNGLKRDLRNCTLNPADLAQHFWHHYGDGIPSASGDDIARRTILLVANSKIFIEGPVLTIVGNDNNFSLLSTGEPVGDFCADNLRVAWKVAAKELRWDDVKIAVGLTPAHLQVDKVDGDEGGIAILLRRHWAHLSIMWLADRVSLDPNTGSLIALINGDRAKAEIVLSKQCGSHEIPVGIEAIGILAYQSFASPFPSDRLKFVRIAIARALCYESKDDAYLHLLNRAVTIFKDHEWQWTQFSASKIDAYLKEERDLEDRIAKAVETYDSRISDMIKAVSDTALASVGALIGSMIASVFGGKFNEYVFRVGLYAYALYIFVFPCLYGLINLYSRYYIVSQGYEVDARRITRLIGTERVKQIEDGRIKRTGRRFCICFVVSIIAYIILIICCFVALQLVPRLMPMETSPTPIPLAT
jgi:hypothetical protein